jgi:hypothetical protein
MVNLTQSFGAIRDRYARAQGDLILGQKVVRLGDSATVWTFVRACGGRMLRVVYRCKDGTVRDMVGRGGVHASAQDGTVRGIGHAMASEENLTLSFWTGTHGDKVNTGTGKGYRTLRAQGILALRIDGTDILTDEGVRTLAAAGVSS